MVAGVADAMIGSNSRHADRQTTHVDAPTTHDAAGLLPDAPTRAQHRRESGVEKHKRKHFARKEDKTTKRRPKQLQWKVKAQQPTAHVNEDADTSVRATASDSIDSTSRVEAVSESKKETDSVDEEVDFAVRERQLLKLRAKSLSYPLESSSQETQSGSDDDSATFIQFSRPLVPLPSISARIEDGSEQAVQEVTEALSSPEDLFFPAPFPLERVAALASARVHEILISDFAFHPPELQINAGDVVVWHVSEQTPGMVEHCLDVTLMRASDATAITTSTSTSSAGDKFAWRFEDAGAVTISCSVYNARGSVVVNGTQAPEPARTLSKRKRAKIKKQKKSKRLNEARAATNGSAMPQQATEASVELNGDVKGESEPVEIFHCPPELLNHGGVPNMDAGLCQAVLSQLDAVANSAIVGVNASSGGVLPVIVVGDVECPISEDAGQEADAGAAVIASDNAEDNNTDDEVADFQERVVAMLKRSEETQAEQRRSFVVDDSGFDALRAYDFFKRRKLAKQLCLAYLCEELTRRVRWHGQVSRTSSRVASVSCTSEALEVAKESDDEVAEWVFGLVGRDGGERGLSGEKPGRNGVERRRERRGSPLATV